MCVFLKESAIVGWQVRESRMDAKGAQHILNANVQRLIAQFSTHSPPLSLMAVLSVNTILPLKLMLPPFHNAIAPVRRKYFGGTLLYINHLRLSCSSTTMVHL